MNNDILPALAAPEANDTFWGMPLWLGLIVAVLIIFGRGQAYYWAGRGLGLKLYASRLGRRIGEERIRKVEDIVRKRGAVAVFGAHWVAGFRHAIPVCAGVIRMSYPWYLLGSALGSLIWTPPWVVGGYAVVWGWLKLLAESPAAAAATVLLLAALITGLVLWRRRRAARAASAAAPAAPAAPAAEDHADAVRHDADHAGAVPAGERADGVRHDADGLPDGTRDETSRAR
ncbi:DedA family protein [Bailinhaonella thermotolerans]|uniref:VTT domain-containing protein n=1 Tax=Bailinhaonella thermotolerans TaxID=1070861 RepID=A0A3A4AYT1_9ACTN|nr:VTT domain-containing protein [Bailinhaonella thermotolerans]RJL32666.1 hypothetical protein D5H75_14290 [Bailinhaonella thermotolerans]